MLLATELEDIFLGTPIRVMLTDRSGRTFKLSASGTSSLDERLLKIPNGSILRFHQTIAVGTDLSNIKYGLGVVGSVTHTAFSTNAYGAEVETSTTTFFIKVLSSNFDPEITDISNLHFDLETPYGASSESQLMYPNKFPTIFDIQNYFDGDDAEINNYINYVLDNTTGTKPHVQKNIPFNSRSVLLSPINAHKLDSILNDISLLNNGSSTFTFQPDQQRAMFYIKKSPDYRNEYHFVALEPSSCKFLLDFKIIIDLTTKSTRGISIHNNSINAANFNIVLTECSLSGDNYEYYQVAIWNSDRDYAFQMSDVHLFTDDVDSVYSFSAQPNLAEQSLTFGDKDYVSLEDELERCDTYGNYVKQVTQPYKTKEIPDNVDLSSTTDPGYYFKNRNVDLIKSLPQEYDTSKGFVIFVFPKKKDDDEWVRYLLLNVDGDLFMGNSVVISREGIYDDDMYVDFDPNESYSIGSIVWYGSILYKFDVAHSSGTPWNISEVHSTSVLNEIIEAHPDNRSADDIFIVRNDENEVYAYGWNDTFTDLESKYRVWTGENSELTSTYYYRRELVWRVVTQDKNMTTIHPHTDLAQLRVSGYYSGDGSQNLLNCPTNTSFTMIVYPDGTNYLLVDSNNMAYTGRNVGSFESPNIDWTNINNRYASSQLSSGADLTDLEGGPGLYYAASQGLNIQNAPKDVGYPFIYQILPNSLNESPLRLIYDSKNQVFLGQLMQGQDQTHTFKYIEWENVSDTDYIATELSFGTDLYTVVEPGFYYSKQNSREQSTTQSNDSTSRTLIPPFTNIPDALRVRMENGNCYFSMLVSPTVQGGNISYTIIDDMGNTYFGARGELDPSTQSGVIHWNDVQTNIQATLLTSNDNLKDILDPGYYYSTGSSDNPTNSPTTLAFRLVALAGSAQSTVNTLIALATNGEAFIGSTSGDSIFWSKITGTKTIQAGDLKTNINAPGYWYGSSNNNYTNTPQGITKPFSVIAIPEGVQSISHFLLVDSSRNTYVGTISGNNINWSSKLAAETDAIRALNALSNEVITNFTTAELTKWKAVSDVYQALDATAKGYLITAELKKWHAVSEMYHALSTDVRNYLTTSELTKWKAVSDWYDGLTDTAEGYLTSDNISNFYKAGQILRNLTINTVSSYFTDAELAKWKAVSDMYAALDSTAKSYLSTDNIKNFWKAGEFLKNLTASETIKAYFTDSELEKWKAVSDKYNALSSTSKENITDTQISQWKAVGDKFANLNTTSKDTITDQQIARWKAVGDMWNGIGSSYQAYMNDTNLGRWKAVGDMWATLGTTYRNYFNEAEIEKWHDAGNKKHEHGNKAVIDTITDQKISNWDSAVSDAATALTNSSNALQRANSAQSTANNIAGTASAALTQADAAYAIANEALNKQSDKKIIYQSTLARIGDLSGYIKYEDSQYTLSIQDTDKQPQMCATLLECSTGASKINIEITKIDPSIVAKNRSITYKFLVIPSSGSSITINDPTYVVITGSGSGAVFDALKQVPIIFTAGRATEIEVILVSINEMADKFYVIIKSSQLASTR